MAKEGIPAKPESGVDYIGVALKRLANAKRELVDAKRELKAAQERKLREADWFVPY